MRQPARSEDEGDRAEYNLYCLTLDRTRKEERDSSHDEEQSKKRSEVPVHPSDGFSFDSGAYQGCRFGPGGLAGPGESERTTVVSRKYAAESGER